MQERESETERDSVEAGRRGIKEGVRETPSRRRIYVLCHLSSSMCGRMAGREGKRGEGRREGARGRERTLC